MIEKFLKRFFKRVEETPVIPPQSHELVDGQAFAIKHYPMNRPIHATSSDILTATASEGGEVIGKFVETIDRTMVINCMSCIRFNDSLGYKHAVGAIFGERKTE